MPVITHVVCFLSTCLLILSATHIFAKEKFRLRVGYDQKPEEARAELDAIRTSVPDLKSWQKRRAQAGEASQTHASALIVPFLRLARFNPWGIVGEGYVALSNL